MNYGTFGIINPNGNGLVGGLNAINKASITQTSPPNTLYFDSNYLGSPYRARYFSSIDKIMVGFYAASGYTYPVVVNPNNNSVEAVIPYTISGDAMKGVTDIAMNRDKLYFLSYNDNPNRVYVTDANSYFISGWLSVGGFQCAEILYSSTTDKFYFPNSGSGNCTTMNTATQTLSTTFTGLANCSGGLVVDSLNKLYLSSYGSNFVNIYNLTTEVLITSISLSLAYDLAYCPVNNYIYACSYNVSAPLVRVIDGTTNSVVTTINLSAGHRPFSIEYNPSNQLMYVGGVSTIPIAIIDPSSNTVIQERRDFITGYYPTYCPTRNSIYFCDSNLRQLREII